VRIIRNFDAVIVAVRPLQALEIVPTVHPAFSLYRQVAADTTLYNYLMWNQPNISATRWPFAAADDDRGMAEGALTYIL